MRTPQLPKARSPEVHGVHHAQLLACIGEQFSEGDEICGIVVNVRAKQDKLCVWTKTASNEAAQVRAAGRQEGMPRMSEAHDMAGFMNSVPGKQRLLTGVTLAVRHLDMVGHKCSMNGSNRGEHKQSI